MALPQKSESHLDRVGTGSGSDLDFWANWCTPCIASIRRLTDLHARFEHEKVTSFSVTYEPPPYVREFLKEHPIASEIGIDDSFDTFKTFQAWGIPVIFQ